MTNPESILAQADALSKQTTSRAYAITSDGDLTTQAQQQRVDALWTEAEERMNQLRETYTDAVKATERDLERKVVRPPSKDPARMASYRSALDRASAAADAGTLDALLEEAELVGDEDQALAAFTAALRNGVTSVVGAFLEDRPERAADYRQYAGQTASRGHLARSMEAHMRLSMPHKPSPGQKQRY